MASPAALLEAHQIGRLHPDRQRWLLDDVSLAIYPGDRLAIAGPSGSGKTLLLRALALLDPIDRGQITWKSQPVRHDRVPRLRSKAIYLHQRPALLNDTVEGAVRFPFSLRVHRGKRFDRDRAVAQLARLGRDAAFLTQRVANLSGGETQIAALVRALQLDPTILLLDEPVSALDPETARAVEGSLLEWVEETALERAWVWVTHDAAQADRIAQRTVRVRAGRLVDANEVADGEQA
jgi:putative ABC transport system ATP-binding protein